MRTLNAYVFLVTAALLISACSTTSKEMPTPVPGTLVMTTGAFSDGETIPTEYTCEGADINPGLRWEGLPEGTQTLALIVSDPDAPGRTFYHWGAFNIDPGLTTIEQGLADEDQPFVQAKNGFGERQYGGPCPPPGSEHRYFFDLYALDTQLNPDSLQTAQDVEKALQGHILAQARIMGRFSR